MKNEKAKIYKPYDGGQDHFVRSNCDIAIYGGVLGSGKSSAAVMMMAEPSFDSDFAALLLRNNLGNTLIGGGLVDEYDTLYGELIHIKRSGTPSAVFPSKSRHDFNHMADQTPDVVTERVKGWQYDCIYFDELTGFEWDTFAIVMSRNRGTAKWTGKIRGSCNPKKTHWLRTYLDWYIDAAGYIIPERDGIVRYLFQAGETVEDIIWGASKKDVYEKAKIAIDARLKALNGKTGNATYEDVILSSVFYKGNITENKAMLGRDKSYLGKIGMMGSRRAQANIEGCWNVDPDEDLNSPIKPNSIKSTLSNDPCTTGEWWITADIADEGNNNMVIIVWNGFHVVDKLVLPKTTPEDNASNILALAAKYQIANTHIIFDANNARYIQGYIPNSIPFISTLEAKGLYARTAHKMKALCFLRLVEMINNGDITISEDVATSNYPIMRQNSDKIDYVRFFVEFQEECNVVRFVKMPNGKLRLITKNEMKKMLGKGRSTDIIDTFAMRMYPLLDCEYGREIENSTRKYLNEVEIENSGQSVYDFLMD